MMPEGWTGLNVIPPNRSGLVVSKKSTEWKDQGNCPD
jgi:hypothetical protein